MLVPFTKPQPKKVTYKILEAETIAEAVLPNYGQEALASQPLRRSSS